MFVRALIQSDRLKAQRRFVKRARAAVALAASGIGKSLSRDAFTRREKRLNSSREGRAFLRACVIARHPWEYWQRRQAARGLAAVTAPISIDHAAGYSRFSMADFDVLPGVVERARTIYEARREQVAARRASSRKREFMEEILSESPGNDEGPKATQNPNS